MGIGSLELVVGAEQDGRDARIANDTATQSLARFGLVSHRACHSGGGQASASAVIAQLLAAIEMNWSGPWGKPLSK